MTAGTTAIDALAGSGIAPAVSEETKGAKAL